jgi:hypothetical protein
MLNDEMMKIKTQIYIKKKQKKKNTITMNNIL